jgi:MFS family permease
VNSTPFLMGTTGKEERAHVFSVWSALIPLAGFAGSLVAGLLPGLFASAMGVSLDHPGPYRYPLLIAAALLVGGVLALLATRRPAAGQPEPAVSDAGRLPLAPIALLTLVYLLRSAGEAATITFFNVYLDAGLNVSTALIGTVMAVGQLLGVPAALAAPPVIARWGKAGTVGICFLGLVLSLTPMALIPHWFVASLGLAGFKAMLSLMSPAFLLLSQEAVPPGWRPAMSGAITMGQGVSISALAFGGGYAIMGFGYRSPFSIAAVLAVAGGLLFWAFFLRAPGRKVAGGASSEGGGVR